MNILDMVVFTPIESSSIGGYVLRVLSCGVHENISSSKSKKKISQVLIITGVINIVSLIMILSKSKQLEFLSR